MKNSLFIISLSILLFSCKKLDTFQKINSISNAKWHVDDVQDFTFNIQDTSAEYHHYVVLRNDDDYDYSNIWMKILIKKPQAEHFTDSFLNEFLLYDKNGYSYGEQQGTLWNYKLPISHKRLHFTEAGEYTIRVQQVMREDNLNAIMNVGWVIEKK